MIAAAEECAASVFSEMSVGGGIAVSVIALSVAAVLCCYFWALIR